MATTTLFPDATNTGLPAGVTLTPSGGLVITQPGTVISGLDIQGTVFIQASNVTLQNCKITAAAWSVVTVADGVTGAVVKNCEIDGVGTGNDGSCGISGHGTFTGNNIYNVENGMSLAGNSSVIENNYIHDLQASGAPHYDGIQIDGNVSDVAIRQNTIINNHDQTSAIMIDNWAGAISSISIDNNLLAGGGYTVYSDGRFNSAPITDVSFTNNHIGGGAYGPTSFDNNNPTYTGNVNDGESLVATHNTAENAGNTAKDTGGSASTDAGSGSPPPPLTQTADTVAPDAPVIAGDTVVQDKVQVSGTAEAGSTINLYEGSTLLGATHTAADGHWSVTTSSLTNGAHTFVATAADVAGNTSDLSQALDPVVGPANSNEDSTSAAPDTSQNCDSSVQFTGVHQNQHHGVTLTGTSDPNSEIKLYDGTNAFGSVTADDNGDWSFKTAPSLNKMHAFTAQQVDSTGNAVAVTRGEVFVGSKGNDKLVGTSGDDTFVGKGGADTFVFAPNFGHDVITDFVAKGPRHDTVDFSKSVFDSFAGVLAHASQVGHDVVISTDSDALTLKNAKLGALDSHDFHFG